MVVLENVVRGTTPLWELVMLGFFSLAGLVRSDSSRWMDFPPGLIPTSCEYGFQVTDSRQDTH